jgi:CheY-like chemotaxis protein
MREVVSASSAKGNCSKSVAANLIDICIEMDACSAILSMQINRALDVCEAMRPGGRLKPRYESVSFDACLVWGLNVMASLQSKVSIRVLPYPTELSSGAHIITDKVWLMENFLCLLSNAVKYSLEDSIVTVKISIKNYHSVRSFYSDSSDDSAEVRLGPSFPPDPKDKDRKSVYTVAEATEKLSASMKAPAMHLDEHEEDGAVERDSTPAAIRNFHESSRPKLLLIEVHDGGIGIPREKRNLLFRPFIQSDSQRRSGGGTGMGLYSVALRIAELGGKFGMRSARGSETESSSRSSSSTMTSTISTSPSIAAAEASNPQGAYEVKIPKHPRGSVFYFAIPFVEDADLLSDAPPSVRPRFKAGHPSSNASSSTSGSGSLNSNSTSSSRRLLERLETERVRYDLGDVPTVLLVDDSAPNLTLLTRAFQQEGLQVHTASDGVSALKRMQEGVYTLVLLDIQMPIMDGIECVKQLREWENKSNCPPSKIQYIVGTSASSIAAMDATACGMDDFTMKPFEVKLVTEKVWSQRRRRRVQQQLLADAEKLSISQHLHYLTPNLLKDHQVSVMSTQIAGNPGAGNSVCSSTTTSSSSKSSGKRKKRKVSSIDSSSQPSASTGSAPLPPLSPIFSREERGLLDQAAEITSVIPPSPRLSPLVISGTVKSSFSSVSPVDSDYSPPGDDEVK